MIRSIAVGAAMVFGLGTVEAHAQDAQALGRKLGDCMVAKSTGEDRLTVARWFLGVLASAPQAKDVTVLQPGKKEMGDRAMATLFTRLIAKDCAAESKALFAIGGSSTAGFRVGGEALGRVAMTELLGNPATAEALAGYVKYLKEEDFANLKPAAK